LPSFGFVGKVWSLKGLVFSTQRVKLKHPLFGGSLALAVFGWPNKSVKGTRRPVAILKFSFSSRFGGFVQGQ
jgi:hypothetical protein